MYEHLPCNRKSIMGSAQSNPTSTQADNRYSTHLNAWKYSYNAHKMQCMKFLRSNLQNPSQKFCKNLFDFEKPQNFQKSQKLKLKSIKCMKMRDLDTYQVKSNLIKVENLLGMKFREREMCLEGETVEINQERSWSVRSESQALLI